MKRRLSPAGQAQVQRGDELIRKRKIKDKSDTYKQGNVNVCGHVNQSTQSKSSDNNWIQASTKQKRSPRWIKESWMFALVIIIVRMTISGSQAFEKHAEHDRSAAAFLRAAETSSWV